MPNESKQSSAKPKLKGDGGGEFCGTPPVMWMPGATRSGFIRPSEQGPRLDEQEISSALSASESVSPQASDPLVLLPPLAVERERTLAEAPTVITFFAEPGESMPCEFLGVQGPALPAANAKIISWFPATPDCASRTSLS